MPKKGVLATRLETDSASANPVTIGAADIYGAIVQDLGGEGETTEMQRQIAERMACVASICRLYEMRFLSADEVDTITVNTYLNAVKTLINGFRSLGHERKAKEVENISIYDYIKKSE